MMSQIAIVSLLFLLHSIQFDLHTVFDATGEQQEQNETVNNSAWYQKSKKLSQNEAIRDYQQQLKLDNQQDSITKTHVKRKKIGLALSGGGAKGFAHIGVLQVLHENRIPIDYLSGTSMGAIIGGLYASGYSIDSLEAVVRTIRWNDMYFDKVGRLSRFIDQRVGVEKYSVELPFVNNTVQIPIGVINGQRFYNELLFYTYPVHSITDFDELPIPFRAVATDLSNGKAIVLKQGSLAKSIRASMSLPSIFTPVQIEGRKLIDGGIARNLPAVDAKNMGADFVIGVDVGDMLPVSSELNNLFAVLEQTVSYMISNNVTEQYPYCDALIKPDVSDLSPTAFDSLDTFIRLGREAALYILPELLSVLDTTQYSTDNLIRAVPHKTDSLTILSLHITGISNDLTVHVQNSFLTKPGVKTTAKQIEDDINRLIGTELFEDVHYEILPVSEYGYQLSVEVKEKKAEYFNFGFRFDNVNKSAFIFNLNLRDRLIKSSEFGLTFRAGEHYLAEVFYRKFRLIPPRLAVSFSATGILTPIPVYEQENRIGLVSLYSLRGTLNMNSVLTMHSQFGIFFRGEYFSNQEEFGRNLPLEESGFVAAGIRYEYDKLSRLYYPEKGLRLSVLSSATTDALVHEYRFIQSQSRFEFALPLSKQLTLHPFLFAGVTAGTSIPNHYHFFAGSPFPSLVLPDQEIPLIGFDERSIQALQLSVASISLHYEYSFRKFISLHSSFSMHNNELTFPPTSAVTHSSYGISLGFLSPFGPIQLYALNSTQSNFSMMISIGYRI